MRGAVHNAAAVSIGRGGSKLEAAPRSVEEDEPAVPGHSEEAPDELDGQTLNRDGSAPVHLLRPPERVGDITGGGERIVSQLVGKPHALPGCGDERTPGLRRSQFAEQADELAEREGLTAIGAGVDHRVTDMNLFEPDQHVDAAKVFAA